MTFFPWLSAIFRPATEESSVAAPNSPAIPVGSTHKVIASSFADPADVRAFKECKAAGGSDGYCFRHGDNGVGYWGDNTAQTERPMCALPPDDMIERFGTIPKAKHARVRVTVGERTVICILADRMPWKRNITNGCGIDLNPAAAKLLGLRPPFTMPASWEWA